MAVIAAVELDNRRASGSGTREPQSSHTGFGTGIDETNFFGRRNGRTDAIGELEFEFGGRTEGKAARRLIGNSSKNLWMRVAKNGGAVRADIVDKTITVGVKNKGTFTTSDK